MSRKVYIYDKSLGRMVRIKRAPLKKAASTWPRASDSLSINPEQITAERTELAKHGVSVDYEIVRNDDGLEVAAKPIFRDQNHKKRYHRALQWYDADAGYGDAEPLHFRSDIKRENIQEVAAVQMRRLQAELQTLLRQ